MPNWQYTKLPDSRYLGSVIEWHSFAKDGQAVVFSCDHGDDTETSVLVNGVPWGKMKLDHPSLTDADFSRPETFHRAAEYVLHRQTR